MVNIKTKSLLCFLCITYILFSCTEKSNPVDTNPNNKVYYLDFEETNCIYNNYKSSAFTGITEFEGDLYLTFREGPNHSPQSEKEYGTITILRKEGNNWVRYKEFAEAHKDLRDPHLIVIGGELRLYCGYNQLVNNYPQHRGTLYAIIDKDIHLKEVKTDAPHIVWLWKIRKNGERYYSIGYLEGEKPILFISDDGINWNTQTIFDVEGIVSEADMAFSNDSMYVCLRKDTPVGAKSYWGKSRHPFTDFSWNTMKRSIASPELSSIQYDSRHFVLAGREYILKENGKIDSVLISACIVDADGIVQSRLVIDTEKDDDKGYPSIKYIGNDQYLMSYYSGIHPNTKIYLAQIDLARK